MGRKIALQTDRRAVVLCVVDVWDFDGSLPRAAIMCAWGGWGGGHHVCVRVCVWWGGAAIVCHHCVGAVIIAWVLPSRLYVCDVRGGGQGRGESVGEKRQGRQEGGCLCLLLLLLPCAPDARCPCCCCRCCCRSLMPPARPDSLPDQQTPEEAKFKLMVAVNKCDLLPQEATATRVQVRAATTHALHISRPV